SAKHLHIKKLITFGLTDWLMGTGMLALAHIPFPTRRQLNRCIGSVGGLSVITSLKNCGHCYGVP
ncbi:MAG: hypothetical protein QGG53_38465, partial [Planctomycetota bacterium]|nr:hypothetical protein [Planctomycetota bacterium]